MSMTAVRQYFRIRMDGLGHREWKDGFNFENIPETIQNRSYHILTGPITGNSQNQTVLDSNYNIELRLFLLGYRNPADAIDEAIEFGQAAICDIIDPVNANTSDIKTVNFIDMSVAPRDVVSNDNSVILQMNFLARLFIDI